MRTGAGPPKKATVCAGPFCARLWLDQNLRLNDIVTVGTHNSYKSAIPREIMSLIRMGDSKIAAGLDYSHLPLTDQLNDGARAIGSESVGRTLGFDVVRGGTRARVDVTVGERPRGERPRPRGRR